MATLILKATEACNSECLYCEVVRRRRGLRTMSPELLRLVFTRIDAFLQERPAETMQIIWHGGEPLLLGAAYFEMAHRFQQEVCPDTGKRISHAIQSNLTLFDESFVPVFQRMGINQIGSSYDPIAGIRGKRRGGEIDSAAYNRAFMRGDALARRHGFSSGIICVVTRYSLERPLDLFHFLANLKLGSGFDFHPVLIDDASRPEVAITPQEYVDFLGAIFPEWWNHRQRYGKIDPFAYLHGQIAEGHPLRVCCDSGDCARSHFNVGPDGALSQCGRSADWGILDYGTIQERTLSQALADEQRRHLSARNALLPSRECAECRFWSLCHGGCPLDSWFSHRDFHHKTNWCQAKRGFIEGYYEPITGIRWEPAHDG